MKNIKITTTDAITFDPKTRAFPDSDALVHWSQDQVSGIDLPMSDTASTLAAALEPFRTVEIVADGVRIKSSREFFGAVAAEYDGDESVPTRYVIDTYTGGWSADLNHFVPRPGDRAEIAQEPDGREFDDFRRVLRLLGLHIEWDEYDEHSGRDISIIKK